MKRTFIQLLSITCAVYFLMAGTGFNFVRYCCDSCANEGIEVVALESCAGIHHNNHDHEGGACCSHNHDTSGVPDHMSCDDITHDTDGCHLYRIQTDIPSITDNINLAQENEITIIDFNFPILDLLFTEYIQVSQPVFVPPDNIPLQSGRDILAYHAVLLI